MDSGVNVTVAVAMSFTALARVTVTLPAGMVNCHVPSPLGSTSL